MSKIVYHEDLLPGDVCQPFESDFREGERSKKTITIVSGPHKMTGGFSHMILFKTIDKGKKSELITWPGRQCTAIVLNREY